MKGSLTTRKEKPNMIRSTRKGRKRKRDPSLLPPPSPSPPPPPPPQPKGEEGDITPINSIPCLNNVNDMKRFEESEDCFILGFDPSDNTASAPTLLDDYATQNPNGGNDDDDIRVIAEKGQVACRDFPHARHLCVKYPFRTTPHKNHCELCFCYICDSPAPCKFWTSQWHCAAENAGAWPFLRNMQKSGKLRHKYVD